MAKRGEAEPSGSSTVTKCPSEIEMPVQATKPLPMARSTGPYPFCPECGSEPGDLHAKSCPHYREDT